nr:TM1812 family CRISPR-associated protein [uncultured Lachnoanaerobaculum sp.]
MKSIILLAMSTLNANVFSGKPGDTFSVYGDAKKIENCKSQLEPVVRYFLSDSECANEVEILMLCTRQTLEIATDFNGNKFKDEYGNDIDNISAVTFLMDRIDKCDEKHGKEITYKAFPLYREGEERILPEIDCNKVLPNVQGIEKSNSPEYAIAYEKAFQPDYISGMREAIQSIRNTVKENMQKDKDFKTPFYIVTHGGPRDVMLSLNAVVSLLDEEGIIPTKICGTNLATKMIDDQRASFDIFRFVSGMQDFLNVGSVDTLQNYYKESVYLYSSDREDAEEFNKKLLDAMNKVSIGVQYSNPESYISGLDDLKKVLDTDVDDEFEKTSLGIFKDTIKKDFGVLLEPEKRTEVDMVERCINKKQYQQALTFLESELPQYYKKKGIISFPGSDYKKSRKRFNEFLSEVLKVRDTDKSPVLIIKRFINNKKEGKNWEEALIDKENWNENLEDNIEKYIKDWQCSKNNCRRNNKYDPDSIGDIYNFIEDILPILKMHKVLKLIRNSFSHSDGYERPEISELDEYMRCYLTALKKLVEKGN